MDLQVWEAKVEDPKWTSPRTCVVLAEDLTELDRLLKDRRVIEVKVVYPKHVVLIENPLAAYAFRVEMSNTAGTTVMGRQEFVVVSDLVSGAEKSCASWLEVQAKYCYKVDSIKSIAENATLVMERNV